MHVRGRKENPVKNYRQLNVFMGNKWLCGRARAAQILPKEYKSC